MSRAQQYIDLYEQTADTINQQAATLLNAHRDEAFARFKQVGFPTNKDEAYLYCPVLEALDTDYGFDLNHLTVPANAITTVDGEMGVVVVQPDGNYFLPVTIISQDSNEAHIVPQLSNILSVGSVVLVF